MAPKKMGSEEAATVITYLGTAVIGSVQQTGKSAIPQAHHLFQTSYEICKKILPDQCGQCLGP